MSFFLQSERIKMLFILSFLFILLATFKPGSATDLVDLPLSTERKSANINATLTDVNAGTKYFIQESISASGPTIRGKIEISGEKDSYKIYYNTDSNLNKIRLVIHGTNCLPYTFKNNWDQTLPGINRPVSNLVLLMGPSILYRLGHASIVWKSVADKNIRGTMMKGARTKINERLRITYYYKKNFDDDYGIKHPSRIEFSGYDPYSSSSSSKENILLDIYLQDESYYDQLVNEVYPLPGIGCPHYLSTTGPSFPRLSTHYVHYTMYEYIQGSTTTRTFSEIHASRKTGLLRLKENVLGVTTEAIYDYHLGVTYLFQEDGRCRVLSADLNSPGIVSHGYFSFENLLLLDFPLKYIGKFNLEHRSGFPVDAWEGIEFNVKINGKKADKAVVTQYFAKSHDSKIFPGYTLVSTKIAIYKLDSSKKTYTLTDGITRDYMNFEQAGSEDEFHDIFTLKECKYLTSDKKITLAFKLQPEDDTHSSQKLTKSHVYQLKQDFMLAVIPYETISKLRIDNIEYNFNDAQLEMEVTFLDLPNFQFIFNSKTMSVSSDTFKKMKTIKTKTEFECLNTLSKVKDDINVVIYRPSDSSCGYLTHFDDINAETEGGEPCTVYHFPLHNLRRIGQELPLDQLHQTFLQDVGNSYWLLSLNNQHKHGYKLIDVIDKTKNQVASTDLYLDRIKVGAKINSNDQDTVIVPDTKTFADCYRTCHNSEQLECNTFSFCDNGDCRVSSLLTVDFLDESNVEKDKSCSIHTLNVINEYSRVLDRKFKTQISIAVDKSAHSCAESCHASPDCFSFQWCDFSHCSFGGFYTDAATEYDDECSIYLPKVSEKYQKTGNKIVSDVLYTEMNLNFEQCASLCHGWSDGDTRCKSFNYCPKSRTESSCSLTQLSVKSSNTKTTEGDGCSNYELKGEPNGKKSKEYSSPVTLKGTSGSGAFGIIMLFLFVGGLLGFAAPFGYIKVKQMRNALEEKQSFIWRRQIDEQVADQLGISM